MNDSATLLVVDDDVLLRKTLINTLADAGYDVLQAGNGHQALSILATESVDLIIADVSMPGMNGYQLLAETRKEPHLVAIPFLFMSARTMDSDVRYALELGADHYLRKPVNMEDLLAMVRGRLRHSRELSRLLDYSAAASHPTREVLDVGRLHIHLDQHQVILADDIISLSVTEFKLVVYLAKNANTVVSPQEIVKETHDLETDAIEASNLVRPLIRSLRRRLGYETGETGCIENVRGVGYKLVPPTG
jgi:DNA-binding response OmpR family regulator